MKRRDDENEEIRAVEAELARLEPVAPPPALRDRVGRAVREAADSPRAGRARYMGFAAAALFVASVFVSFGADRRHASRMRSIRALPEAAQQDAEMIRRLVRQTLGPGTTEGEIRAWLEAVRLRRQQASRIDRARLALTMNDASPETRITGS